MVFRSSAVVHVCGNVEYFWGPTWWLIDVIRFSWYSVWQRITACGRLRVSQECLYAHRWKNIDLITDFIACGRVFWQDKLCWSVWSLQVCWGMLAHVGTCWLMLYVNNMTWAARRWEVKWIYLETMWCSSIGCEHYKTKLILSIIVKLKSWVLR